ncbi:type I restriction enzyme S subunit [Alicyclobacillus sacchari]|uniref:Type I restriction enzyme S subunit n=1 Tax=Alicyclobacillus sacchari TaxID=392010 RepID=A0A4R8LIU6_9BACL|nr:restriction endonuclease subunit S [Alicyclobacillus sacchari]TDY42348.1 type I restriction enzyme S subunit [Alicyclobacillus sacchari]GMA58024.1 hypothetical protein GCM10025858_25270 [Alicyclobacillus sacchari]
MSLNTGRFNRQFRIPSDWQIDQLSNLSVDGIRNGVFNDPEKSGKGVKLINVVNLYSGSCIDTSQLGLLELSDSEISKYRVEVGDIFFTRSSLKLEGIAQCNINLDDKNVMVFDDHIMRIRPDTSRVVPEFLREFCSSSYARSYFMRQAKTTTMTTIGQDDLGKFLVFLPPYDEQEKIAEVLATWNRGIELTEKLIQQKKAYYKGLSHELLTGKLRWNEAVKSDTDNLTRRVTMTARGVTHHGYRSTPLGLVPSDWSVMKLSDVVKPVSREVEKPSMGYWRLGIRSHAKGSFHEYIENPDTVSMDKLYVVKENDLIVNITFAWEHAVCVATKSDDGKLVSHRFPTYEFKSRAVPQFYKYYIMQPHFKYLLQNISPGGAGRNRVMSKRDFLNLDVIVPPLDEQKKIAEILTLADNEVSCLETKLELLKQQKRGLMDLLLSGEVRV